jgi:type IV pilus assembly protein PilC
MSCFVYRAIDASGQRQQGRAEAHSLAELDALLRQSGLELLQARVAKSWPWHTPRRALPLRERIHFCFHLEQLTRAGVPLLDALQDLQHSAKRRETRQITARLLERIEAGCSLSQALRAQGKAFDEVFCALVHVGECSGQLPQVLQSLSDSLKREDELRAFLGRILIYPCIVLVLTLAAVVSALLFVVPQLTQLFMSTGQTLPLQTRALIGLSAFLQQQWLWLITTLLSLSLSIMAWLHWVPQAALLWDRCKLRIPQLGELYRKIILARFAKLFAIMYASGITVIDILILTQGLAGNRAVRRALEEAATLIAEGQQLSAAFAAVNLFPPLSIHMLRIGEQTGSLDTALRNLNYFYERDVSESVARFETMLEPALSIVMGALMLWVAMASLAPIYDIVTQMKT